jgi:hypothetical protein
MRKSLSAAFATAVLVSLAPAAASADASPAGQKLCERQGGTYEAPFPPTYGCFGASIDAKDREKAAKECEKSGGTLFGPSILIKPTYLCDYSGIVVS